MKLQKSELEEIQLRARKAMRVIVTCCFIIALLVVLYR